MDNEKEFVHIQAEKKFYVFDDYFYSNHSIEIVKDYINTTGVGEDDIDKWFGNTIWDVNGKSYPILKDFGVDVTIEDQHNIYPHKYHFPIMMYDKWLKNPNRMLDKNELNVSNIKTFMFIDEKYILQLPTVFQNSQRQVKVLILVVVGFVEIVRNPTRSQRVSI